MADEPTIDLSGLSIWIDGRQFPQSDDFWDANLLNLRVLLRDEGATVKCSGAILMTTDLEKFRSDLKKLHNQLSGSAELAGLEPNFKLTLTANRLGHIAGVVEITPDHLSQFHRFEFGTDQSYLPNLIKSLDQVMDQFPILHAE